MPARTAGISALPAPSGDGSNPARHLTRPRQPGAPRRDPARLALTSRRNTTVTTNAPRHAVHQDQRKRAGYQLRPDPESSLVRQKISCTRLPSVPAPSRFRRHHNQAKLKIPIDHRRNPAGSCLGGFRAPAPCLAHDLPRPASENLRQRRHSGDEFGCSEADIPARWQCWRYLDRFHDLKWDHGSSTA
jgi:hypothetical protein